MTKALQGPSKPQAKAQAAKRALREMPLGDALSAHRSWVLQNSTVLAQIPSELTPGARHGQFSYTCHAPSGAVVEVLFRDQAYYVKVVGLGGVLPSSRRVRWDRDGNAQSTWKSLRESIKW